MSSECIIIANKSSFSFLGLHLSRDNGCSFNPKPAFRTSAAAEVGVTRLMSTPFCLQLWWLKLYAVFVLTLGLTQSSVGNVMYKKNYGSWGQEKKLPLASQTCSPLVLPSCLSLIPKDSRSCEFLRLQTSATLGCNQLFTRPSTLVVEIAIHGDLA